MRGALPWGCALVLGYAFIAAGEGGWGLGFGFPGIAFPASSALFLALRGSRRLAGIVVAAAAAPWAVLWAVIAARMVGGEDIEPYQTLIALAVGIAVVIAGLLVVAAGDALADPDPHAPAGRPGSRRALNLSAAMSRRFERAFLGAAIAGLLAAALVNTALRLTIGPSRTPGIVMPLVLAAVFVPLSVLLVPARVRRAFEALAWVGEWELETWRALRLGGVPRSPGQAERWLAARPPGSVPDWLRHEVLLVAGRYEEARRTAMSMPVDGPFDRFRRALLLETTDWMGGGAGDRAAVADALAAIPAEADDDRLRAEVLLAYRDAQHAVADGGDWAAPLADVRGRIGPAADGLFVRAWRRPFLASLLLMALVWGGLSIVAPAVGS